VRALPPQSVPDTLPAPPATMANRQQPILVVLLLGAMLCAAGTLPAQTKTPYKIHVDSNMAQKVIRVESNMVVVPTFVFDKKGMGWASGRELKCIEKDTQAFHKLSPSEPYLPADCYRAEVLGLPASSFHLFEDGVEQKLLAVVPERWNMEVRDNATWHLENSDTPTGKWATADVMGPCCWTTDLHQTFYNLEYVPQTAEPEKCHKIQVKVNRRNSAVYARDEYCTGQSPSDPLRGTAVSNYMEKDLASGEKGEISLSAQAGYTYLGKGAARVHVALEFPWNRLSHEWRPSDWTLQATIGVLGTVVDKSGTEVSRFSDLMYPSYWPTFIIGRTVAHTIAAFNDQYEDPETVEYRLSAKDWAWLPNRYDAQLDLPPGQYNLRVVLSDGKSFGAAQLPLNIDDYDGKQLALSSVILCKRFRSAHASEVERSSANFAPLYVPLVSKETEYEPSGDTSFRGREPLVAYFEVYDEPAANRPASPVELHMKVAEAKSGKIEKDCPPVKVEPGAQAGASTVPVALRIPFDQMRPGAYRLEVQATDSAGRSTAVRTAGFTIR
jgi:hypothetical protein